MTSATFRCLVSGQYVTFTHQVDIDSMEGHPDYEYVEEDEEQQETPAPAVASAAKKMGRPKKAVAE